MSLKNAPMRHRCRELYYKYRTLEEIVEETSVKMNTLKRWVFGGFKGDPKAWYRDRSELMSQQIRESVEKNSKAAHGVVRLGFEMVQDSLVARAKLVDDSTKKRIPLSIGEAKDVTRIITSIAKLMALSSDEPMEPMLPSGLNDNRNPKALTIADLRDAILKDPFINNLIPMKREKKNVEYEITDAELESSFKDGPLPGDYGEDARRNCDE